MKVAVVGGTAGLGYGLAMRLARAGDDVLIGSRSAEKGVSAADSIRSKIGDSSVQGGQNSEVSADADAVVVTVPFPGLAAIYKELKSSMKAGTTVIDCNVPLASEIGGRPTRMLGVWEGSAAQMAKSILGKDFHVASGFHTVMAAKLEAVDSPLAEDVLVCGDQEARTAAEKIVSRVQGARFVDCGPLENARILESLTALIIGINSRYEVHPGAGIRFEGLP